MVTDGALSLTGPGTSKTGYSPVFGSDWKPLRYGKKSTASEVVPVPSAIAVPWTGFSGAGGLVGTGGVAVLTGEIAGPVLVVTALVRRPHQLFSAFTGVVVLAVVPSRPTLKTPYALSVMLSRSSVLAPAPS